MIFVDLLTGEILLEMDRLEGKMALHHLDGNKSNDDIDNLVYIIVGNHTIITKAQSHYSKLAIFFEIPHFLMIV